MIDTTQSRERNLIRQIQRERQLTSAIINAAQDLKDVAGDPSPFLLEAARVLERTIVAYYREALHERKQNAVCDDENHD